MAYTLPEDDEEKQQGATGAMGMPGMGASTGGATTPNKPKQQGSGFVGWEQILNANKDAATNQANKLAGGIVAAGQQARTGLAGAQQSFRNAAAAAVPVANTNQLAPVNTGALPAGKPAPAPVLPVATPNGRKTAAPTSVAPFTSLTGPKDAVAKPSSVSTTGGEGTITPEEAKRLSEATYTGPQGIEDTAGWEEILRGGKDAVAKANALGTEGGIEALLQGDNIGPSTAGGRFDAALLGGAGKSRFRELQKEYGGLLKDFDSASKSARADAEGRKEEVAKIAASAKGKLSDYETEEARKKKADDDAAAAAKAEKDKYALDRAGKGTYDEYTTGHEVENTLKDVGFALNPVDWILSAAGQKTMTEAIAPGVEKWANQNVGSELNSSRFRFKDMPFAESEKRALFEDLTTTELRELERMGKRPAEAWLDKRLEDLRNRFAKKNAANADKLPAWLRERTGL